MASNGASFQTAAASHVRIPGLELSWMQIDTNASWGDLTLVVWEEPEGGLDGFVSYADQLFDALTHARFDVFFDRFRVDPGVDFQRRLTEELAHKSMVLLLECWPAIRSAIMMCATS